MIKLQTKYSDKIILAFRQKKKCWSFACLSDIFKIASIKTKNSQIVKFKFNEILVMFSPALFATHQNIDNLFRSEFW